MGVITISLLDPADDTVGWCPLWCENCKDCETCKECEPCVSCQICEGCRNTRS